MIGICIISLSVVPLHAADQKPVLKLDDAIKSGFVYSNQISLNSKELELLRERLKSREDNSYVAYQTVYLQKAKNEQQKEILQDCITYDITNRYNMLVVLQKEITQLDHSITITIREMQQMKVKKELGLVDDVSYDSMEIQLQDLKNSKQSQLELLNNDQSYFKLITGKDVAKYTLEDVLIYETFRIPGAVDNYMDSKIEDYLKRDSALAQFAKDNILTDVVGTVYYSDYLDKNYNADKSLSLLEDTKKEMKDALKDSYASLINQEEQISNMQAKRLLAQKQVSIAKVKYQIELITELDYQKQSLSLEDIELNLTKLTTQYNLLKQVIQKPWSVINSR